MIILSTVIETALIVVSFIRGVNVYGIVMSIAFLFPAYIVIVAPLAFHVQVNGSIISVRTAIGKRFSFNVSEITKIDRDIHADRQMHKVSTITIYTATKELSIDQKMNGFQEMVVYLLDKLDTGEIDESAISTRCRRVLSNLRIGEKSGPYIDE